MKKVAKMIRRKKKTRKFRGSRSHGWGITKGHKGKGIRGGFGGNAGLKSLRWIKVIIESKRNNKGRLIIGKHGFKRPQNRTYQTPVINVSHLEARLPRLVKQGLATFEDGKYHVDLGSLGYEKLLAQGKVTKPIIVSVESASENAIAKIEKAGGKVVLSTVEEA